jgi:hypothetical protein
MPLSRLLLAALPPVASLQHIHAVVIESCRAQAYLSTCIPVFTLSQRLAKGGSLIDAHAL